MEKNNSGNEEQSVLASDVVETKPTPKLDAALTGRELDAAVAERVMGFEEVERIGERLQYHNVEMDRTSETGGRWHSIVPHYSTNIAAAMEVVEKMGEAGWCVAIREYRAMPWDVTFRDNEGNSSGAPGVTLPEAICRAALQATNTRGSASGTADQDAAKE